MRIDNLAQQVADKMNCSKKCYHSVNKGGIVMGYELSNGAIELRRKRTGDVEFDIVLALFDDEFVTWLHNKRDDAFYHGHYFGRDLEGALNDFKERE